VTPIDRLARAARRHGAAGLPAAAARRLAASWRTRAEARAERAFDRRRRISTAGVFRDGVTPYQPVHPAAFAELVGLVPCDRSATTFVDIGSGRGRALFLAVEHGFRAAVGVELDPDHHRIAAENLRRYRGRRGAAIRLVHGDARALELPAGPLLLFIYNPFGPDVMGEFLAGVVRQLRAAPRPAWLVYEAPLHRELFDAEPRFSLLAERTDRSAASPRRPRFAIYAASDNGP
jgi:SAM-dependent methyltransferase